MFRTAKNGSLAQKRREFAIISTKRGLEMATDRQTDKVVLAWKKPR